MYEVVWTRRLSLTLGHTVLAVSSVVSIFMLGLGVGGYLGGRLADRRPLSRLLKDYAWFELLIAVWGALSPFFLGLFEDLYLRLAASGYQGFELYLCGFLGASTVLLVPTMAMGATLPFLCRLVVQEYRQFGAELGRLYGFNTLGGCFGSAAAGFFLLPGLGLNLTVVVAVVVNVLIAAMAYRMTYPVTSSISPSEKGSSVAVNRGQLVVACLAAAAAMACQVGWTRGLILSLGSSTYAFAAILTFFLVGLGLGSLYYRFLIGEASLVKMGWLQFWIGVSVMVSMALLGAMPYLVFHLSNYVYGSFVAVMLCRLVPVGLLLLVPTILMGMVYPLAAQLYTGSVERLGRTVGTVYAATTLGSVLGAFGAGFLGVPLVGAQGVLKLAALTSLFLGLACFLSQGGRFKFVGLVLVGSVSVACFALPAWNQGAMSAGVGVYAGQEPAESEFAYQAPAFYRDGLSATVAVHVGPDYQTVRVNGKIDASLQIFDRLTMYLTGYVPGLLHRDPREVVVIGFGAGMTVEALSQFSSVERIDCVELEPAILEAGRFWKGYNGDILENPKVHTSVNDGRTFILASDRRFDLIASEPSNPWIAGVGTLFTEDFYGHCRRRLKPGGIMCQWFHMYGMSEESVALVVRTFFYVFPEGAIWRSARGDILLLGAESPLEVDLERLEARWMSEPALRRTMLDLNLYRPENLLGHYWLDRSDALEFAGTGPLNTDDLPLLEYRAPLTLFEEGTIDVIQARLDDSRSRLIPAPETPELLGAAGIGWLNVRRPDLVMQHISPKSDPLVWALMMEEKQPDLAADFYQEAISVEGWVAHFWRGEFLGRQTLYEEALRSYQASLQTAPETLRPNILQKQADCALAARLPEIALQASAELLDMDKPTFGGLGSLYRGRALYQQGRFEEALKEFESGAQANPSGLALHFGRAHSLIRLGRDPGPAYDEIFSLSPAFLQPYLELARYRASKGREAEALQVVERARQEVSEADVLNELVFQIRSGEISSDDIFQ